MLVQPKNAQFPLAWMPLQIYVVVVEIVYSVKDFILF